MAQAAGRPVQVHRPLILERRTPMERGSMGVPTDNRGAPACAPNLRVGYLRVGYFTGASVSYPFRVFSSSVLSCASFARATAFFWASIASFFLPLSKSARA